MESFPDKPVGDPAANNGQEALKKSEERFRSLLGLSSDWYWEQDENLRFNFFSRQVINPSDPQIGKTRWELSIYDVPEAFWDEHKALLAARKPFRDRELPLRADAVSEVRFVAVSGEPVFDPQGNFKGYRGVSRDITQRKLAELQLRDAEALARSMLDGLSAAVCILDGNGTIVAINNGWDAYCAENDRIPGHVCVGSDYLESVGGDPGPHLDAIAAGIRELLGGEREAFVCEYPRHSSRTRRWYLAKAARISGKGPLRVVISHDDITPIKRAQQILAIEKRVLELLAADSHLQEVLTVLCREFEQISWEGRYAVWALDAEGGGLRLGAAPSLPPTYLEAVDGIAPGEGAGSCAAAVFRREPVFCADIEHDPVWASLREVALLHGLRASWSFPMLRGSEVLGAMAVYFGSPREPDEAERELLERATHIAGLVLDHARAEERRRLMAEVFVNSQEGIIISDAQNRIVMVNRAFTEITGYTASEALGRNPRMLSSGLQDTAFYQAMWSDIHSKGRWQGELWDQRKNGDLYYEHLSVTTVRNQRGDVTHYVAIFADVTGKKAAEEKILRMNVELEHRVEERTRRLAAANKELEAFSYSVSHDLRAPLRSIEGFSRIVSTNYAEKLDDAGRDYLERISRATRRMNQLIDDMLKLSRISMSEVHKSRVDLSSMARTILADLSSATAPTRSLELRVEEHLTVEADPGLVRIALQNLLANAWKFTSRTADARIEVSALPGGEGNGFLVRDNGAGFDMKYAEKLFGTFQRLHGPAEFEGTGVGLAIVRRIANLHGWSVQAEGETGKGAVFRVVTSLQ